MSTRKVAPGGSWKASEPTCAQRVGPSSPTSPPPTEEEGWDVPDREAGGPQRGAPSARAPPCAAPDLSPSPQTSVLHSVFLHPLSCSGKFANPRRGHKNPVYSQSLRCRALYLWGLMPTPRGLRTSWNLQASCWCRQTRRTACWYRNPAPETGGGLGGAPATRTSGKRLVSGAQALGREARRALSSEKMLRCPGTPGRTMDVIKPRWDTHYDRVICFKRWRQPARSVRCLRHPGPSSRSPVTRSVTGREGGSRRDAAPGGPGTSTPAHLVDVEELSGRRGHRASVYFMTCTRRYRDDWTSTSLTHADETEHGTRQAPAGPAGHGTDGALLPGRRKRLNSAGSRNNEQNVCAPLPPRRERHHCPGARPRPVLTPGTVVTSGSWAGGDQRQRRHPAIDDQLPPRQDLPDGARRVLAAVFHRRQLRGLCLWSDDRTPLFLGRVDLFTGNSRVFTEGLMRSRSYKRRQVLLSARAGAMSEAAQACGAEITSRMASVTCRGRWGSLFNRLQPGSNLRLQTSVQQGGRCSDVKVEGIKSKVPSPDGWLMVQRDVPHTVFPPQGKPKTGRTGHVTTRKVHRDKTRRGWSDPRPSRPPPPQTPTQDARRVRSPARYPQGVALPPGPATDHRDSALSLCYQEKVLREGLLLAQPSQQMRSVTQRESPGQWVLYHFDPKRRATSLKGHTVCYLLCDAVPVYPPDPQQVQKGLKEDADQQSGPETCGRNVNIPVVLSVDNSTAPRAAGCFACWLSRFAYGLCSGINRPMRPVPSRGFQSMGGDGKSARRHRGSWGGTCPAGRPGAEHQEEAQALSLGQLRGARAEGRAGPEAPSPAGTRGGCRRPGSSQHPLGKLPACYVERSLGNTGPVKNINSACLLMRRNLLNRAHATEGTCSVPPVIAAERKPLTLGLRPPGRSGPRTGGERGGWSSHGSWQFNWKNLEPRSRGTGSLCPNPAPGETRGCRQPSIPGCCRRVVRHEELSQFLKPRLYRGVGAVTHSVQPRAHPAAPCCLVERVRPGVQDGICLTFIKEPTGSQSVLVLVQKTGDSEDSYSAPPSVWTGEGPRDSHGISTSQGNGDTSRSILHAVKMSPLNTHCNTRTHTAAPPAHVTGRPAQTLTQKDTCTPMFTAAPLTAAKTRKQPTRPLAEDWVKQMRCLYAVEHYSAIENDKVMPFAATWMDPEVVILSVNPRKEGAEWPLFTLDMQEGEIHGIASAKQDLKPTHESRPRTPHVGGVPNCAGLSGHAWGSRPLHTLRRPGCVTERKASSRMATGRKRAETPQGEGLTFPERSPDTEHKRQACPRWRPGRRPADRWPLEPAPASFGNSAFILCRQRAPGAVFRPNPEGKNLPEEEMRPPRPTPLQGSGRRAGALPERGEYSASPCRVGRRRETPRRRPRPLQAPPPPPRHGGVSLPFSHRKDVAETAGETGSLSRAEKGREPGTLARQPARAPRRGRPEPPEGGVARASLCASGTAPPQSSRSRENQAPAGRARRDSPQRPAPHGAGHTARARKPQGETACAALTGVALGSHLVSSLHCPLAPSGSSCSVSKKAPRSRTHGALGLSSELSRLTRAHRTQLCSTRRPCARGLEGLTLRLRPSGLLRRSGEADPHIWSSAAKTKWKENDPGGQPRHGPGARTSAAAWSPAGAPHRGGRLISHEDPKTIRQRKSTQASWPRRAILSRFSPTCHRCAWRPGLPSGRTQPRRSNCETAYCRSHPEGGTTWTLCVSSLPSGDERQTRTYDPLLSSKHQRDSQRKTEKVIANGVQAGAHLLMARAPQHSARGALRGESREVAGSACLWRCPAAPTAGFVRHPQGGDGLALLHHRGHIFSMAVTPKSLGEKSKKADGPRNRVVSMQGWCQGTAAGPPSACKPADQPGRGFLAARASRGGRGGDHFTSWLEATWGTQAPEEGRRPGGRAEGFRHEVLHSHVTPDRAKSLGILTARASNRWKGPKIGITRLTRETMPLGGEKAPAARCPPTPQPQRCLRHWRRGCSDSWLAAAPLLRVRVKGPWAGLPLCVPQVRGGKQQVSGCVRPSSPRHGVGGQCSQGPSASLAGVAAGALGLWRVTPPRRGVDAEHGTDGGAPQGTSSSLCPWSGGWQAPPAHTACGRSPLDPWLCTSRRCGGGQGEDHLAVRWKGALTRVERPQRRGTLSSRQLTTELVPRGLQGPRPARNTGFTGPLTEATRQQRKPGQRHAAAEENCPRGSPGCRLTRQGFKSSVQNLLRASRETTSEELKEVDATEFTSTHLAGEPEVTGKNGRNCPGLMEDTGLRSSASPRQDEREQEGRVAGGGGEGTLRLQRWAVRWPEKTEVGSAEEVSSGTDVPSPVTFLKAISGWHTVHTRVPPGGFRHQGGALLKPRAAAPLLRKERREGRAVVTDGEREPRARRLETPQNPLKSPTSVGLAEAWRRNSRVNDRAESGTRERLPEAAATLAGGRGWDSGCLGAVHPGCLLVGLGERGEDCGEDARVLSKRGGDRERKASEPPSLTESGTRNASRVREARPAWCGAATRSPAGRTGPARPSGSREFKTAGTQKHSPRAGYHGEGRPTEPGSHLQMPAGCDSATGLDPHEHEPRRRRARRQAAARGAASRGRRPPREAARFPSLRPREGEPGRLAGVFRRNPRGRWDGPRPLCSPRSGASTHVLPGLIAAHRRCCCCRPFLAELHLGLSAHPPSLRGLPCCHLTPQFRLGQSSLSDLSLLTASFILGPAFPCCQGGALVRSPPAAPCVARGCVFWLLGAQDPPNPLPHQGSFCLLLPGARPPAPPRAPGHTFRACDLGLGGGEGCSAVAFAAGRTTGCSPLRKARHVLLGGSTYLSLVNTQAATSFRAASSAPTTSAQAPGTQKRRLGPVRARASRAVCADGVRNGHFGESGDANSFSKGDSEKMLNKVPAPSEPLRLRFQRGSCPGTPRTGHTGSGQKTSLRGRPQDRTLTCTQEGGDAGPPRLLSLPGPQGVAHAHTGSRAKAKGHLGMNEGVKIRTSVCSGLTTQKPEMEPAIQVLELVPSHPRRVTVNSRLSRVLHSHRCVAAALIPAGTRGVGAELLNNAASEQPNTFWRGPQEAEVQAETGEGWLSVIPEQPRQHGGDEQDGGSPGGLVFPLKIMKGVASLSITIEAWAGNGAARQLSEAEGRRDGTWCPVVWKNRSPEDLRGLQRAVIARLQTSLHLRAELSIWLPLLLHDLQGRCTQIWFVFIPPQGLQRPQSHRTLPTRRQPSCGSPSSPACLARLLAGSPPLPIAACRACLKTLFLSIPSCPPHPTLRCPLSPAHDTASLCLLPWPLPAASVPPSLLVLSASFRPKLPSSCTPSPGAGFRPEPPGAPSLTEPLLGPRGDLSARRRPPSMSPPKTKTSVRLSVLPCISDTQLPLGPRMQGLSPLSLHCPQRPVYVCKKLSISSKRARQTRPASQLGSSPQTHAPPPRRGPLVCCRPPSPAASAAPPYHVGCRSQFINDRLGPELCHAHHTSPVAGFSAEKLRRPVPGSFQELRQLRWDTGSTGLEVENRPLEVQGAPQGARVTVRGEDQGRGALTADGTMKAFTRPQERPRQALPSCLLLPPARHWQWAAKGKARTARAAPVFADVLETWHKAREHHLRQKVARGQRPRLGTQRRLNALRSTPERAPPCQAQALFSCFMTLAGLPMTLANRSFYKVKGLGQHQALTQLEYTHGWARVYTSCGAERGAARRGFPGELRRRAARLQPGFHRAADRPARKVPISKVHHSMHSMNMLGTASRISPWSSLEDTGEYIHLPAVGRQQFHSTHPPPPDAQRRAGSTIAVRLKRVRPVTTRVTAFGALQEKPRRMHTTAAVLGGEPEKHDTADADCRQSRTLGTPQAVQTDLKYTVKLEELDHSKTEDACALKKHSQQRDRAAQSRKGDLQTTYAPENPREIERRGDVSKASGNKATRRWAEGGWEGPASWAEGLSALFTIAKTWKRPKCPTTGDWIKQLWYIYTTEYYSAIKKSKTMPFAATWMDLEIVILNRKNWEAVFAHAEPLQEKSASPMSASLPGMSDRVPALCKDHSVAWPGPESRPLPSARTSPPPNPLWHVSPLPPTPAALHTSVLEPSRRWSLRSLQRRLLRHGPAPRLTSPPQGPFQVPGGVVAVSALFLAPALPCPLVNSPCIWTSRLLSTRSAPELHSAPRTQLSPRLTVRNAFPSLSSTDVSMNTQHRHGSLMREAPASPTGGRQALGRAPGVPGGLSGLSTCDPRLPKQHQDESGSSPYSPGTAGHVCRPPGSARAPGTGRAQSTGGSLHDDLQLPRLSPTVRSSLPTAGLAAPQVSQPLPCIPPQRRGPVQPHAASGERAEQEGVHAHIEDIRCHPSDDLRHQDALGPKQTGQRLSSSSRSRRHTRLPAQSSHSPWDVLGGEGARGTSCPRLLSDPSLVNSAPIRAPGAAPALARPPCMGSRVGLALPGSPPPPLQRGHGLDVELTEGHAFVRKPPRSPSARGASGLVIRRAAPPHTLPAPRRLFPEFCEWFQQMNGTQGGGCGTLPDCQPTDWHLRGPGGAISRDLMPPPVKMQDTRPVSLTCLVQRGSRGEVRENGRKTQCSLSRSRQEACKGKAVWEAPGRGAGLLCRAGCRSGTSPRRARLPGVHSSLLILLYSPLRSTRVLEAGPLCVFPASKQLATISAEKPGAHRRAREETQPRAGLSPRSHSRAPGLSLASLSLVLMATGDAVYSSGSSSKTQALSQEVTDPGVSHGRDRIHLQDPTSPRLGPSMARPVGPQFSHLRGATLSKHRQGQGTEQRRRGAGASDSCTKVGLQVRPGCVCGQVPGGPVYKESPVWFSPAPFGGWTAQGPWVQSLDPQPTPPCSLPSTVTLRPIRLCDLGQVTESQLPCLRPETAEPTRTTLGPTLTNARTTKRMLTTQSQLTKANCKWQEPLAALTCDWLRGGWGSISPNSSRTQLRKVGTAGPRDAQLVLHKQHFDLINEQEGRPAHSSTRELLRETQGLSTTSGLSASPHGMEPDCPLSSANTAERAESLAPAKHALCPELCPPPKILLCLQLLEGTASFLPRPHRSCGGRSPDSDRTPRSLSGKDPVRLQSAKGPPQGPCQPRNLQATVPAPVFDRVQARVTGGSVTTGKWGTSNAADLDTSGSCLSSRRRLSVLMKTAQQGRQQSSRMRVPLCRMIPTRLRSAVMERALRGGGRALGHLPGVPAPERVGPVTPKPALGHRLPLPEPGRVRTSSGAGHTGAALTELPFQQEREMGDTGATAVPVRRQAGRKHRPGGALSLVMGGPQGWSERLRGGGRVAGTEWGRGGDGPPGAAPGRQAREGSSGEREGPAERPGRRGLRGLLSGSLVCLSLKESDLTHVKRDTAAPRGAAHTRSPDKGRRHQHCAAHQTLTHRTKLRDHKNTLGQRGERDGAAGGKGWLLGAGDQTGRKKDHTALGRQPRRTEPTKPSWPARPAASSLGSDREKAAQPRAALIGKTTDQKRSVGEGGPHLRHQRVTSGGQAGSNGNARNVHNLQGAADQARPPCRGCHAGPVFRLNGRPRLPVMLTQDAPLPPGSWSTREADDLAFLKQHSALQLVIVTAARPEHVLRADTVPSPSRTRHCGHCAYSTSHLGESQKALVLPGGTARVWGRPTPHPPQPRAQVVTCGQGVPQTGEGTLKTLVSSWVSHLAVMPTASERNSWLTMTQTLAPGTRRQATHRAAGGAHPRTPSALNSGRTVSGRQLPRHPSLPGKENSGARHQTLLWLKSPSCHQPGPAVTLPPDSAACGVCQRCTRTATVSLMVAGPGQSPTSAHPPCEALTLQEKRPATQQHEGRPPTPPRADRWTRGRGVPPGPAPPRPAHFRPCSFHRIPPAGYLRCTQRRSRWPEPDPQRLLLWDTLTFPHLSTEPLCDQHSTPGCVSREALPRNDSCTAASAAAPSACPSQTTGQRRCGACAHTAGR
ncbi:LINE-1 retrotransposable element ORF2 protein [Camelus dromedarius]|uniref:LINE-1 retrotransposable element ORF2 protein n=1 Tax=Camelus dromedarius TaxID=9838 RepID=A0A5N4D1P3_CAMDR|nr:LINE-1 retrotransposable element ORF2 protein [Camelus dromedarius]